MNFNVYVIIYIDMYTLILNSEVKWSEWWRQCIYKLKASWLLQVHVYIITCTGTHVPYSTKMTPTLIACYKAATGGMGLM